MPGRRTRLATVAAAAALVAACSAGPAVGPDLATVHPGGGNPAAPSSSTPPRIPPLPKPANQPAWSDCKTDGALATTQLPADITVDCATVDTTTTADNSSSRVELQLTRYGKRATLGNAPILTTTGGDLPATLIGAALAQGPAAGLLDDTPVIAIERRGTTGDDAINCISRSARTALWADGGSGPDDKRVADTVTAAKDAADNCSDILAPDQANFGAADAARDIDTVRSTLGMKQAAVWGVGSGAVVAMAWAAGFPATVGRLIIDNPVAYNLPSAQQATQQADGLDAMFTTANQLCLAGACDPVFTDRLTTLLGTLATSGSPLSDTQALNAIQTTLALRGLAAAANLISAAARNNWGPLTDAWNLTAQLRATDGNLLNTCNDVRGGLGSASDIIDLAKQLGPKDPVTGRITALDLARCAGWPTADAPPAMVRLPVPVLILNGTADPLTGGQQTQTVTDAFARAAVTTSVITWGGLGYGTLANSQCARDVVGRYLPAGVVPAATSCPP